MTEFRARRDRSSAGRERPKASRTRQLHGTAISLLRSNGGGKAAKRWLSAEQIPVIVARDALARPSMPSCRGSNSASITAALSKSLPGRRNCAAMEARRSPHSLGARVKFHVLPAPGAPKPEAPDLHIKNVTPTTAAEGVDAALLGRPPLDPARPRARPWIPISSAEAGAPLSRSFHCPAKQPIDPTPCWPAMGGLALATFAV